MAAKMVSISDNSVYVASCYPVSPNGDIPSIPCVYLLLNSNTGVGYIGSTYSLRKRLTFHLYHLDRGTHPNKPLLLSWEVDQSSSFYVCIIEETDVDTLLEREQWWLDHSNAAASQKYFNINRTAQSHLGRKRSEETRRRLSEASRGRRPSEEARRKMREAKLGKSLTEEHKRKIGDAARGKPCRRPLGIINHRLRRFTPDQVREIRQKKAAGMSYRLLSLEYAIDIGPLRRMIIGQTYKDII